MSHSAIIVSIWLDGKLGKTNRIVIATARGNVDTDKCLAEIAQSSERMYENATTMSDMGLGERMY